jgi:hypothetical protein
LNVVVNLQGGILLFKEIGNYRGEMIADEMPAGDYLLAVKYAARVRWTRRERMGIAILGFWLGPGRD